MGHILFGLFYLLFYCAHVLDYVFFILPCGAHCCGLFFQVGQFFFQLFQPLFAGGVLFFFQRLTVYFQPLRIFMPLGMFLMVIGVGKAIYDVWIDNLSETAIFGMLGAIVVWSFGLIADMMARMQLRPPSAQG